MKDRIKGAFDEIRADDDLLAKTADYLQKERLKREKKQRHFRPLGLAGALAAVVVLVASAVGYRAYNSAATTYVSLDVNPSLELTLNPMDKVIATAAYNEDGTAILQQVDVTGKPYDQAVALLLAEMELQGYISGDSLVTMTVQTKDGEKEQQLCSALLQTINKQVGTGGSLVEVEVFPVTQEVRETANGCHMSAAKYLAIQELMEVDETATLEAYGDFTIRQIRQRIRACQDGHGSGEGSARGEGSGGQQGSGQQHGRQEHHQ